MDHAEEEDISTGDVLMGGEEIIEPQPLVPCEKDCQMQLPGEVSWPES